MLLIQGHGPIGFFGIGGDRTALQPGTATEDGSLPGRVELGKVLAMMRSAAFLAHERALCAGDRHGTEIADFGARDQVALAARWQSLRTFAKLASKCEGRTQAISTPYDAQPHGHGGLQLFE